MPRSLVLGNGSVLATFDEHLQMRDLYYPYVGLEDHTTYGKVHRVGMFVESKGFAWFNDPSWRIMPGYAPETLVGSSVLRNDWLGISVTLEDCVHPVSNVLLRRFRISCLDGEEKVVKLFLHHDFYIYGDKQKDTAFYEPYTNSVIHFREKRYFLIGGETDNARECFVGRKANVYATVLHNIKHLSSCGISSFSIGKSNFNGLLGTWKDAEDGVLAQNPIEQGSVDSTVAIHCLVKPGQETTATSWLCLGQNLEEVVNLQQTILEETPDRLIRNCHNYWKSWVNKSNPDFGTLSPAVVDLYKRSLTMLRMHADNEGGIIAAADSDIMMFNRDTYTYVWPRDGAFVSLALDKSGYGEVSRRFFEFCTRVQTQDGYLLHRNNPDGSLGSSWHPWFKDGEPQLPIQEDETALVLVAIERHFRENQDFEFLQQIFEKFVKKAAQFLFDFREEESSLPLASYDLWEEQRGVFTYTTACTIAGLHAAAHIAHILGHHKHSERYQNAADELRQALIFHLYDEQAGRFVKKIRRKDGQTIEKDMTLDASVVVIWKLGVLPVEDPRVQSTMRQLEETLRVRTDVGGYSRYTTDWYHAVTPPTAEIPGNPWIITTLWMAQWQIATAKTAQDLEKPKQHLEWVKKYATPTGIVAEQLNPFTGAPLSVAPLTWSHATFVETVLMYLEKERSMNG
jgi:GH15 family glucan-1,4-alpha-glucosidase